jgi:hypothetical protein
MIKVSPTAPRIPIDSIHFTGKFPLPFFNPFP